jgi:hypothetical protein
MVAPTCSSLGFLVAGRCRVGCGFLWRAFHKTSVRDTPTACERPEYSRPSRHTRHYGVPVHRHSCCARSTTPVRRFSGQRRLWPRFTGSVGQVNRRGEGFNDRDEARLANDVQTRTEAPSRRLQHARYASRPSYAFKNLRSMVTSG